MMRIVLAWCLIAFCPLLVWADDSPCNRYILRLAQDLGRNPLRYQLRDDRCEGTYSRTVGGGLPEVVSFLVAGSRAQGAGDRLDIGWDAPQGIQKIHIQATAPGADTPFRMDVERRAEDGRHFTWPLSVARRVGVLDRVAVKAWTEATVDGLERDVLLPVRMSGPSAPPSNGQAYELTVVCGEPLHAIDVVLATASDHPVSSWAGGACGALDTATLFVPSLPAPGFYHLTIAGQALRAGSLSDHPISIEAWFFHP